MAAGNATIGALRVMLGIDTAQFEDGLKRSRKQLKSFNSSLLDELQSGFQQSANKAGIMGAALSRIGPAGLAAGAALGAVAAAAAGARKAFTFADDIADTANRLKVSTKALQEYRYAVHALGGEYTDADAALEGFAKAFGNARAGISKKAVKPFEALFGPGFDPKQFATTEDALQAVIAKISNLSSTAEQAAIADKLQLGPMLPAIRAGGAALDEARAKASKFGFVMDDAIVQKGGAAADELEDISHKIDVQLNSALIELAPLMLAVASGFADAAQMVGKLGSKLDELNKWAASKDLLAVFRWANEAGDAFGKATGLNKTAGALGFKSGPAAPKATAAGIAAVMAAKGPAGDGKLSPIADAGAARKAGKVVEASQRAIDAAMKDELAARTALVSDLQLQAALALQAVDQESAAEVQRLKADAAGGDITKAAAATAIALTERAAGERKQLIQQELEQKLDAQRLSQKQAIAGYYDRIASMEAGMATSATARNTIEAKALADRQRLEREALEVQQAAANVRSASDKAAERAALMDQQAVERLAAAHEAQARIAEEALARAQAGLQLQLDLAVSQLGLARSSSKRREIENRILDLQQKMERQALEAVTAASGASQVDQDIAQARLAQLGQLQANDRAAHDLNRSYDDASSAMDGFARAIENHDWNSAFKGLVGAFDALKYAFSKAGSAADKFGAVAGVAQGVGQAIGGTGGKALSGAASGAMAGFSVGGPLGAVAGGIIGGVSSLLGSAKAKRAAKKAKEQADTEAKLAAARDAATAATEKANSKRELEIRLMELSGDAAGALAARRADELGAMDDSLRGLQKQVYAYEDAATAEAKVADARAALTDAYERESSALQDTIDRLGSTAKALRAYGQSLSLTGPGLSPGAMLSGASSAFRKAAAGGGDADQLQSLGDAYLTALQATAPDAFTLARGRAEVMRAVDAAAKGAEDQASVAEQQLQALNDQVGGLIEINRSVLSVGQAIANLAAAMNAASTSGSASAGVTPTASNDNARPKDFSAYVDENPDLAALFASGTGMARGRTKEQFGQYHWANYGSKEPGRLGPVGFATGGSFTMGGWGGTDSQLAQMRLTPGEMVHVTHGDTMGSLVGEVSAMRAAIEDLKYGQASIAIATAQTAKKLSNWDVDGLPDFRDVGT